MGARGRGARKRRTNKRQAMRVAAAAAAPITELTADAGELEVVTELLPTDEYDFTGLEALAAIERMQHPVPVQPRLAVRAELVASGDIAPNLLTSYDLTNGSLAWRWFYLAALDAGFTELSHDRWPTEVTELAADDDAIVFRCDADEQVYRLPDGTLAFVSVSWGWFNIMTAGPSVEAGMSAASAFRAQYPAAFLNIEGDSRVPITFWSDSKFGPTSRLRRVESTAWEPIVGNYSDKVRAELDRLMSWEDGPDNDGALLLWQGEPGTGKTWALRALASEWAKWAEFHYITDPDAFFVSNPSYMIDVLLADSYATLDATSGDVYTETNPLSKWRVLILEDTGELLSEKAKDQYGQGLSRLLNVVDGMIGQGLRVLAIVTTNDELGELHPAVSRPGRCASQIEFGPLSAAEASRFLGETVDEGGTVAELYELARAGTTGEFAAAGQCSGCDHMYGDHADDGGACMADGCSCGGYKEADAPAPAAEAEDPVELMIAAVSDHYGLEDTDRLRAEGERLRVELGQFVFVKPAFDVDLLMEHQPGERLPAASTGPSIAEPAAGPLDAAVEWTAIFAPEGKLTSDGRAFAPGAITWPRLEGGPLTLMAMIETSEGGHVGAKLCGQITRIWRDEAAGLIRAAGTFDSGEYGQEIARLVADQTLRGVSVDLAISRYEVGPKTDWFDADGNWSPRSEHAEAEEPSLIDILFGEEADSIAVVLEAEIGMTTVCPFPAFGEATIAVGDSLVAGANPAIWTVTGQAAFTAVYGAAGSALTASATLEVEAPVEPCVDCEDELRADADPVGTWRPSASVFLEPEPAEPCGIHIGDDRSFSGYLALWETCHIGIQGRCQKPPPSPSDYTYFHLGEVLCEDGERVSVGTITLDTGHAAAGLGRSETTRHYDDTGTVTAYVVAVDGEHGIWCSGFIPEFVPDEKVELLRGAKLSGDWRKVDGALELVAILTVNVPGFPVPRARQLVAGGEVVSLVASGIPIFEGDLPEELREKFTALAAQGQFEALAAAEAA